MVPPRDITLLGEGHPGVRTVERNTFHKHGGKLLSLFLLSLLIFFRRVLL